MNRQALRLFLMWGIPVVLGVAAVAAMMPSDGLDSHRNAGVGRQSSSPSSMRSFRSVPSGFLPAPDRTSPMRNA